MHQTLTLKVKNISDQPYQNFQGIAVPHLKIKCINNSSRIQNMLKYHQVLVSDIPLKLAESILLRKNSASGPWKVHLPSGNGTYSICQSPDQKISFGEIGQNTVWSNESGLSYLTMKPAKMDQIVDIGTEIGSINLIQDESKNKCQAKIDLIVMNDTESNHKNVALVKVEPKNKMSLMCQKEFLAVNIQPKLIFFKIVKCNQVRYVLENTMEIRVRNTSGSTVQIKKGTEIAYAECCHGHYPDSNHFK